MSNARSSLDPKKMVEQGYDRVAHDYACLEGEAKWPRMQWLKPGGFLLISMEAGDYEDVVGEWLGVPMFISCFEPGTMRQLVVHAGFELLEAVIEIQVERNVEIPYHWIFARKC